MSTVADSPTGVILSVRVVPRASRSEIAGLLGDAVKVRLQAPPVDALLKPACMQVLSFAGLPQNLWVDEIAGRRESGLLREVLSAIVA
jgi:hypothetical protein